MTSEDAIKQLQRDPENPGAVLGWGVVRMDPWSLKGVFPDKAAAEAEAKLVGDGHTVQYGTHWPGTDDFVWSSVTTV